MLFGCLRRVDVPLVPCTVQYSALFLPALCIRPGYLALASLKARRLPYDGGIITCADLKGPEQLPVTRCERYDSLVPRGAGDLAAAYPIKDAVGDRRERHVVTWPVEPAHSAGGGIEGVA